MNSEKLKVKNEWLSNSIHYSLFTLHLTGAKLRYHKGQSQGKGLREVRIYTIKKYVKCLTVGSRQWTEDRRQWAEDRRQKTEDRRQWTVDRGQYIGTNRNYKRQ